MPMMLVVVCSCILAANNNEKCMVAMDFHDTRQQCQECMKVDICVQLSGKATFFLVF